MTGYNARLKGEKPKGTNIKDGHGQNRPKPLDWEGAGFTRTDWNSHSYKAKNVFLTYHVRPGELPGQRRGLIVRLGETLCKWFPYRTSPCTIRDWIMQDAEPGPALDWDDIEAEMEVEGMVIPF